jgi:Carboxypeptidase regulatory-like domain/TonB-dependent Receptor Plug Domain
MSTKTNRFSAALCLLLLIAAYLLPNLAGAQTVDGAVTGQVTDTSGAAIPGATVTVTNTATGVSAPVQTNKDGIYTVRFLPIGQYKLSTNAPGFAEKLTAPFALEINQTVKINTVLSVGSASSSVEVTDTAPIINTTDGVISTTFSENEIQTLPLEGRNFQSVALFTPGVVSTDPSGMTGNNAIERSTTSNNLISVNGNRGQANYFTLDGVDINEPQNNQISYNVAPDALQEIKVISGNAPAIYGNVNGGDIIAVLKSGTNSYHGSAYFYLQNDKLNANSWSHKYQGEARDRYTQSTFGGTFGGPVRIPHLYNGRDKLFFFGDYEGIRLPSSNSNSYQVLTPAMLNGDFSAIPFQLYNTQAYDAATNTYPVFAGNQIPVNNPVAKYLIAHPGLYPTPNALPLTGTYIPRFVGSERGSHINNQFDAKVDWTPGTADHISGFYAQSRAHDFTDTIFPIGFSGVSSFPTTLFGASWVHTFSSAIVNQFNVGFTRTDWDQGVPLDRFGTFGLTGDSQVGIPFGTQRYVGFAEQYIPGGNGNIGASSIGNRGAPQLLVDNTYGYNDNLTIQHGRHLFTVGVQAVRYQENYTQSQNAGALGFFQFGGNFTQNPNLSNPLLPAADFVLDAANAESLLNGGEFGNRQWRAAGYFQDDWKVTPRLTLNLGIRYEFDQPMVEANNKNANILPLNGGTIEYAGSVPVGAPAGSIICPTPACYNANYKQIMPRFGFAYQAASNISVRGGYGATSFFEGNAANQRLTDNPPLVSAFNLNGVLPSATSGGTALHASDGFNVTSGAISATGGQFGAWPQNIQPAYLQQYNLTVETQLNSLTSLSMGYVGQVGRHLIDYGNVNQFTQAQAQDVNQILAANPNATLPTADLTPYYKLAGSGGNVLITESRASANYNGLQVTVRQREAHGLEYNLNYTFAKSISNAAGNYGVPNTATTGGDQTFQDYFNSKADYGPSGDDIRNQFNAVIVYALPYGHGRQFGASSNIFLQEVLGGWSLTNAFKAFTGPPVTIVANGGNTGSFGGARANQYSRIHIVNRSLTHWFGSDPTATPCTDGSGTQTGSCAYGQPSTYTFGTAANGTERAPGFYQLDTSLFKDFKVFHEQTFGFRSDFFNLLNVADYSNPDNNIQHGTFGLINNTRNQERRMQLSLNYKF